MTRTRTDKETKAYKARQIQTNTDKYRQRQRKTDQNRQRQTKTDKDRQRQKKTDKRQSNLLPKVLQYTSCMCNILTKTKTKTEKKIYNICETGTQIVARSILTILLMPLTHVQQIDNDKD